MNTRLLYLTLFSHFHSKVNLLLVMLFIALGFANTNALAKTVILTNHLGYYPAESKNLVIQSTETLPTHFSLINNVTKEVVYQGETSYQGAVDKWRDWQFWQGDFSDFTTPGTYRIKLILNTDNSNTKVASVITSEPFSIQADLYEQKAMSNVINYFKAQRSSGLRDKADKNLGFHDSESKAKVNVSGGWFDATGDYGKHLSHLDYSTYFNPQQTPLAVWSLYASLEVISKRNDPNLKQYQRRLLDEALFGSDYLVRIKVPKGSFYQTIMSHGVEKKPEDRRISHSTHYNEFSKRLVENNTGQDKTLIYQASMRGGAGLAIASLAIAARQKYSGEFTQAEYLEAAEQAFEFLSENNGRLTNDGQDNIVDEYTGLMAATELYKTTGKGAFFTAAYQKAQQLIERKMNHQGHYFLRADEKNRVYFHPSDAGLPYVSLLNFYDIADQRMKKNILKSLKQLLTSELAITSAVTNPFGYARQLVENMEGEKFSSFFFPHQTLASPWWQGENARLSSLAATAKLASNYFEEDEEFHTELQRYATNQLNWILGLNPFDSSMLQGSGRNVQAHYWINDSYQYTGATGGIINGITAGLNNPNDIDYNDREYHRQPAHSWRWAEQWLPHSAWFLYAISL